MNSRASLALKSPTRTMTWYFTAKPVFEQWAEPSKLPHLATRATATVAAGSIGPPAATNKTFNINTHCNFSSLERRFGRQRTWPFWRLASGCPRNSAVDCWAWLWQAASSLLPSAQQNGLGHGMTSSGRSYQAWQH